MNLLISFCILFGQNISFSFLIKNLELFLSWKEKKKNNDKIMIGMILLILVPQRTGYVRFGFFV